MLDARFPTYSPGSRRLYEFEEAGDQGLLLAELARTLDAFAATAPGRVAKGQLTREQARSGDALWRALIADLEAREQHLTETRLGAAPAWTVPDRIAWLAKDHGIAWADKVEALRREIEARRTGQEAEIAKGRLTAADARAQLERLEAVHDLYWRQGFAFDGTRGELRAMTGPILDFDVEQDGPATVQPRGDSSRAEQPAHPPEDSGATPLPRSTANQEQVA